MSDREIKIRFACAALTGIINISPHLAKASGFVRDTGELTSDAIKQAIVNEAWDFAEKMMVQLPPQ